MNRRDFFSTAALSAAGLLSVTSFSFANNVLQNFSIPELKNSRRRFLVTQEHTPIAPEGSIGITNIWIPIPEDAVFQRLISITVEGNYDKTSINANNAYGAKTVFATWAKDAKDPKITVKMEIETLDWEIAEQGFLKYYEVPETIIYPKEVAVYLEASKHIAIDGIVKETAEKIIGNEKNPLEQARLIHKWVSANMTRDNSVIGCGLGDVKEILESGDLSGKCTDINSVFVALARAVGIPAREMFGIRVGQSTKLMEYSKAAFGSADEKGFSNITGAQHCRAMFYLAGFGWVPCDPADVTKMRLYEKKEHSDPAVQYVDEYMFGNWEMNWIGFNFGRDFEVYPVPEQGEMNNFGYPYAEVDGDPLNFYDPKTFKYNYESQELFS